MNGPRHVSKFIPGALAGVSAAAQRARILAHLRAYKTLTTLEARRLLDCCHPAARVQELREEGFNIVTHWTVDETTEGGRHRVAKYVLLSKKAAA